MLAGYLSSLPAAAPDWRFLAITDAPLPPTLRATNLEEIRLPKSNAAVFDHIRVPRAVRRASPDVFLATKNTVPKNLKCPAACMYLDLAYFAMPLSYPLIDNLYMRAMFRSSARRAARIVAISRHTAQDVKTYLGAAAFDKTRVVYPGISSAFREYSKEEKDAAALRFASLPERFVLYAGNISPRKNLDRHPNYILAAYMASGT